MCGGGKDKQASIVLWSGQVKITWDLCELWLLPTEIESVYEKEMKTKQWETLVDRSRVNAQSRTGTEKKILKGKSQRDINILYGVDKGKKKGLRTKDKRRIKPARWHLSGYDIWINCRLVKLEEKFT